MNLRVRSRTFRFSPSSTIWSVKLDKTGGLTEALARVKAADPAGLKVMVGNMVGTSLSMAPAFLLDSRTTYCDIDVPVILTKDREFGLTYTQV